MKMKINFFLILIGISCFVQLLHCQNESSSKIVHSLSTMSSDLLPSAKTLHSVVNEYHKEMKYAAGFVGTAVMISFGVWLGKKITEIIDKDNEEEEQLRLEAARIVKKYQDIKSNESEATLDDDILADISIKEEIDKFSQKIEHKINNLIDLWWMGGEKINISIEIFPTTKSKIFALQNIQDFFHFPGGAFKKLDSLIYEVCIKKINELEQTLLREKDDLGKIILVDKDHENRLIDEARDAYMRKHNITAKTLSKITDNELQQKIRDIEEVCNELQQQNNNTMENDINLKALITILGYLKYKRQEEIHEKFFEENMNNLLLPEEILLNKQRAQQKWLKERDEDQQALIVSPEEHKKAIEEKYNVKLQPIVKQKQSILSKIQAALRAWWYRK